MAFDDGVFNEGGSFDGLNDYVNVADSDILNLSKITTSAWIKLDSDIGNTQARIINHQETSAKGWGMEVFGSNYSTS